jgi:hypothetical protein
VAEAASVPLPMREEAARQRARQGVG